MVRKSIYRPLLEGDSDLKLWFENLYQGSPITAEIYLRRLGGFCKDHDLTSRALAGKERK